MCLVHKVYKWYEWMNCRAFQRRKSRWMYDSLECALR